MAQSVKGYITSVRNYELTVRPTGTQWSISIREVTSGDWMEPLHDFANTLEEAQLRACRRASHLADMHIEQSAVGDPCVEMLHHWVEIDLRSN